MLRSPDVEQNIALVAREIAWTLNRPDRPGEKRDDVEAVRFILERVWPENARKDMLAAAMEIMLERDRPTFDAKTVTMVLRKCWPHERPRPAARAEPPRPPTKPFVTDDELAALTVKAIWPILQRPQPDASPEEIEAAIRDVLAAYHKRPTPRRREAKGEPTLFHGFRVGSRRHPHAGS